VWDGDRRQTQNQQLEVVYSTTGSIPGRAMSLTDDEHNTIPVPLLINCVVAEERAHHELQMWMHTSRSEGLGPFDSSHAREFA
jgi:hypothetical protein